MARCVRAALAALPTEAETWEILVVDSASSDGTREALDGLPVRWLGIDDSRLLCASLGRWVGTEHASGEFLLFLDGDMELCGGFLSPALEILRHRPEVAGVVGQVMERDPGVCGGWRDRNRITAEGEAAKFGGAVLFRRTALRRAGGYDPYIFNREENELYSRIRMTGAAVWRLPLPMAIHHDPPSSRTDKLLREILPGRKRALGRAQAFLRSWKKGNLRFYVRQEKLFFCSLLADAATVAALCAFPPPGAWGALLFVQAVSLAGHAASWSPGQYVLNKIAAVQFLAGLVVAPWFLRLPPPRAVEVP